MSITGQKNQSLANGAKQATDLSPILLFAGIFTLAAASLPVLYLVRRATQIEGDLLRTVLFRAKTLEIFITTLSLVLAVVVLATLLGAGIAWALSNVELPGSALLRALVILPVAIPSYVFTYSWLSLGFLPNGFFAAVVVLTLTTTPYVTLAALAAFRRIDGAQLDVAQTLGLNQFASFIRVTLPQIRNALGAVSLLGVDTFTRAIQNTYQGSFDRSSAAILALILVAISSLVISFEISFRQRSTTLKSSVRITKKIPVIHSTKSKVWALSAILLYITVALITPLLVLLQRFLSRITPIDFAELLIAALSTITVSFLGAFVAMVLAIPVALLAVRETWIGTWSERAVLLVHALPGIVMGLALVSFGSEFPFIYQTTGLLAFAYSILFLARSVGAVRTSLAKVPTNLTEIAATLGQTKSRIFYRVTLPLAAPGVFTGTLLVFLSAMKELPATLMLRPTGFETLATEIWNNTAIFRFSEAAPYALLLVAIAAIPTFLISRPDRDTERGELQ
jgi:iron(III) transport system permease protein